MPANANICYVRCQGYIVANLGEELAILDLASGSYLGFNATAAHIWRLLETSMTFDALCQAMMTEFDIDADRCQREVSALIDELLAGGLIRTNDAIVG